MTSRTQIGGDGLPDRVWTFTAKADHFAPEPPEDAVILATYALAVEEAFEALGPGGLDAYLRHHGSLPGRARRGDPRQGRDPGGKPPPLVRQRPYAACQRRAQSRIAPITGFSDSPLLVSS